MPAVLVGCWGSMWTQSPPSRTVTVPPLTLGAGVDPDEHAARRRATPTISHRALIARVMGRLLSPRSRPARTSAMLTISTSPLGRPVTAVIARSRLYDRPAPARV